MPVNISEFANVMGDFAGQGVVVKLPPLAVQDVSTGNESAAFHANTRVIRVLADEAVTVDGVSVAAGVPEYFAVSGGGTVEVEAVA